MPGTSPGPAGLQYRNNTLSDNERLTLQLQRLQGQLQQQHLYQDATHIMVQRAAQLEVDFDQTAAMLCDEMIQRADCQAAVKRFQELYALEQKHCTMTRAALSGTKFQLYVQHQELHQTRDQLSTALAKLKAAENLLAQHHLPCPRSSTAQHSTAMDAAIPGEQTHAAQSALDSSQAQPQDEQRQRDSPTAACVC